MAGVMDSKVIMEGKRLSKPQDYLSESEAYSSFVDDFDDVHWSSDDAEQPLVEEREVQLVHPLNSNNESGQIHTILNANGPEYEQARSALEYNKNELAWDLYHYRKVNQELMQRNEQSVRTASAVLIKAIRRSIDERITRCHDLFCLVSWLDGEISDEVDLLALDTIYGHRTHACENLIQRLGRVLTEQENNLVTVKNPLELDYSILDEMMEHSGKPKRTSASTEERNEDDSQPEPVPEWLNDLMISYSDEAIELANSIIQAEKDWKQDSMYKILKAASNQGPFYPYHPKDCHVHAVLFEVRRGIHDEQ